MIKHFNLKLIIAKGVLFAFLVNFIGPLPSARASEFLLPEPGQMVALSPSFSPVVLKGIKLDPKDPLKFHFYVDSGDDVSLRGSDSDRSNLWLKAETTKLIKYFLTSLTIPEQDLWVNLSPYEKNRIVPKEFGQTEMGRDLLAQDYLLKQITASLIYPEGELGKKFWQKVYAQAQAKYGTTNIPVNTFNKVWIVPQKAVVYENGGTAFVLENHLKVMLEQDYLALNRHPEGAKRSKDLKAPLDYAASPQNDTSTLGSQIIRELVIPALEKEINEGKNFSQLRQVFYSLILATWYKKKIKDSMLAKVYADKSKIVGLSPSKRSPEGDSTPEEITNVELIYRQYLKAFKKGVYNYIKEEPDQITGQNMPRKYFSGGVEAGKIDFALTVIDRTQVSREQLINLNDSRLIDADIDLHFKLRDAAMNTLSEGDYPDWFDVNVFYKDQAMVTKSSTPDGGRLKHLRYDAQKAIEDTTDPIKRTLWWLTLQQANLILASNPELGSFDRNKIDIYPDGILAITFLSWFAQGGHLLPLEKGQMLFYSNYQNWEKTTREYISGTYRELYHEWPQEHQFNQIDWDRSNPVGQAGDKLFEIESENSLLHLHRFQYEMPAPVLESNQALKKGEGIVNIGIYGQLLKDEFAIAKAGSVDPRANVILILHKSAISFERINGHQRAVALTGVIFKDGKPYFVHFEKPLPLDYVINFDQKLAPQLEKEGIPTAGHTYSDEYLEEKDIANRILDNQGIHVPKTIFFLSHNSKHTFINNRRKEAPDVIPIAPKNGNAKWRIKDALFKFLRYNHINNAVVKPNRDTNGNGVMFFQEQTVGKAAEWISSLLLQGQNVIVQERIIPVLVKGEDGKFLDWNARALVARDEYGRPKVSDIVVRIGEFNQPIKGAASIAMDEVAQRLGLDPATFKQLREDISLESERAYDAIHGAMVKDSLVSEHGTATDFMGTDVMVRREGNKLVPYLIEVNGYNSGGGWYLDNYFKNKDPQRVGAWLKYWMETMVQRGRAYQKRASTPPDMLYRKNSGQDEAMEGESSIFNPVLSQSSFINHDSFATSAVTESISAPILRYCLAVYQAIRDDIKSKDITALYGGPREDFIKFLLVTNATRGYFVDQMYAPKDYDTRGTPFESVREDLFNTLIQAHWEDIEKISGLAATMIYELKTMGVRKEEIQVQNTPLGESQISFKWKHPYDKEKKERTIILKHGDYTKENAIDKFLLQGIDIYFQMGSVYSPSDFTYLKPIAKHLPQGGGLVITNNYIMGGESYHSPERFLKEVGEFTEPIETVQMKDAYAQMEADYRNSVHVEIRRKLRGHTGGVSTSSNIIFSKAMVIRTESNQKAAFSSQETAEGGINLNPAQMTVEIKQEGEDFKFNINGQIIDSAQIVGATFEIRQMTPVINILAELGHT